MNQYTEKLVSVFSQDELSALMTAMGGYINTKNKQNKFLFGHQKCGKKQLS